MISNQILQNTIEGLKGIARVELCVMDVDGKEVAATMDMATVLSLRWNSQHHRRTPQEIQWIPVFPRSMMNAAGVYSRSQRYR